MSVEKFLKKIGSNFMAIRKSLFMRQKDVADNAGISYRYYQNIEAGKANITLATLFRLSKFFRVHPSEVVPQKNEAIN